MFEPVGFGIKDYDMKIFNRWGELVFEKSNMGWNGKYTGRVVENGLYVYMISARGFREGQKYNRKGTVMVTR